MSGLNGVDKEGLPQGTTGSGGDNWGGRTSGAGGDSWGGRTSGAGEGSPVGRTPGVSHRKPEKKGGKGPLMIGIVVVLLAAIIGINVLTAKQNSGQEASDSAAAGSEVAGAGKIGAGKDGAGKADAGKDGKAGSGKDGAGPGAEQGDASDEAALQASLEASRAAEEATRPVLSLAPGQSGTVETEAPVEKNAELVDGIPGAAGASAAKADGPEGVTAAFEKGEAGPRNAGGSGANAGADGPGSLAGAAGDAAGGAEEEPGVIVATDENYGKVQFSPHCVDSTKPSKLIRSEGVAINGKGLGSDETFVPWYDFKFGKGSTYHDLPGVITFRGNNWRDDPTYGTADIRENVIEPVWKKGTGQLSYNGKLWTGSGWTGQPLLMKWPRDVKQHMNMYDAAKAKDDLVEVICACMDGKVYFLDLVTGEATRDPLNLGFTFKGAGALDPRGYPILYVGSGYDSANGKSRVFIVNLLDGSVMYTFGNQDPFSLRGSLSYFDASPLVDADSDTLIYPGENGILYLIHLNTNYDPAAGTLSINPDNIAKWHYQGQRTRQGAYWVGMETSPAVYGHHLYVADNGGNLMCIDLQTLKLVWVQDILDDSNSTPVLSEEHGKVYVYVSTSFHLGWRSSGTAPVPVWKIDAETGEIIWRHDYECSSVSGVSGGVQSTIAVGHKGLSDNIYVTVSRTGGGGNGVLACLSKETGETVWEHKAAYAWSSPVCVYNADGSGRIFYAVSVGKCYLLDGLTGEQLNSLSIPDGSIEASPVVYDSRVVLGTRGQSIRGLLLK